MAENSNLQLKLQKEGEGDEEEVLTPSRRSLFRSASWSVRSSPNSNSNLNPNPNPNPNPKSKPNRRLLPPLQPLRRPALTLTSWPQLNSDDSGHLVTPHPQNPNPNPNDLSRVSDHIYLGNAAVAGDRAALRRHAITHVLNCVGSICPNYFENDEDLVYKTLFLQDSPAEDLTSVLYDAFDFLEEVRSQNPKNRVFVHCYKGASRSAAIVIAYIMWKFSKSFQEALDLVREVRAVTNPNLGFASQLLMCQSRVLAMPPVSPGSVVRVYRMAPHSAYDPLHLVPKAVERPWVGKLDSRGAFLVVDGKDEIFVWMGRFCEEAMGASAVGAAKQVVRYEKMKRRIVTMREGLESGEFWDVLVGENDYRPEFLRVGNRRVEMYDLDFEIFKRAIRGGVLPLALMPGMSLETCLPTRESPWNKVRKKFLRGNQGNEGEEDEQKDRFCSPSSLSGDSNTTLGDSASTLSTFSPASSSSLDWHNPSPSGSDLCITPRPPILVSKLPPLHSRKVKRSEEDDSSSSQSLAHHRGENPPSLDLIQEVGSGEWRLSPRDIVRDWCLSPPFTSDVEEHQVAMHTEQTTSLGCEDGDEEDEICSTSDANYCVWSSHPILFRWPSMEKVEDIDPRVLDSGSVFILLAPDSNPELGKTKPNTKVLYLWLGRHSQLNSHHEGGGMSEDYSNIRQIDLDRIRVDLIDRMELPLDIRVQIIKEEEEPPEQFLKSLSIS